MTTNEYTRNATPEVQKMIRAIRRTLNLDYLRDVVEHGADSGFSGFIYTNECARFHDRHEVAIWQLLADDADDQGVNIPALVATFTRVDMATSADGFKNLLAWYALETVARGLTELD